MKRRYTLRTINPSDQRLPCSLAIDDEPCRSRSTFWVHPNCSCSREEWPHTQSCTPHLPKVVTLAARRCSSRSAVRHRDGDVVRVHPLRLGESGS